VLVSDSDSVFEWSDSAKRQQDPEVIDAYLWGFAAFVDVRYLLLVPGILFVPQVYKALITGPKVLPLGVRRYSARGGWS
jgi:hypothetical protein